MTSKHYSSYNSWLGMRHRCLNPKHVAYQRYKNLGICPEWANSFEAFLRDMGPRPKGKELERIDNSKGYFPGNCRWATRLENHQNKRNNVMLEHRGQIHSLSEWSRIKRLTVGCLWRRLKNGWSVEKALTTPRKKRSPNRPPITHNGKTMTISEWSRETGIPVNVLSMRMHAGWSSDRALSTPVRSAKSHS